MLEAVEEYSISVADVRWTHLMLGDFFFLK